MKKRALFLFSLTALSLCGCAVSVESLLSPPKLDTQQSAIYDALKVSKGGDIHLKYPVSGQYRSAVVVKNIDDEESDEAIIFYKAPNVSDSGSSLRLNFLDQQDGEWVSVYDFAALGSEIEKVQFSDLGDGGTSVIVTYALQNSSDLATSIFKYDINNPAEVFKSRHTYMELMDLNNDGSQELFLINHDRTASTASVQLLGWNENGVFSLLSSAPLESDFSKCENVGVGVCDEINTTGIFIDYSLTDGSLGTSILVCDDNRIYKPENIQIRFNRRTNTYTPLLLSKDIDGDGITEIPSTSPFPRYQTLSEPEQVNYTIWYQLSEKGDEFAPDTYAYISIRNDYMLKIPTRWIGLITVKVSITDGTVAFSEYNHSTDEIGEELLVIRALSEAALEKADLTGYTYYGKNARTGYSFYIKNNFDNSFGLTEAELLDYFKIIE